MKYTNEITINLPLERVIELFDNPDNLAKWQPGLISFEHLSGEPGHPGAKSKILYQMGKRRVEMIETVTKRNLPQEFSGTYETKGVWNGIKNSFTALDSGQTKWVSENEFKFSGFFMKMMAFLMPGAFKKQSMQFMEYFKAFAEKEGR